MMRLDLGETDARIETGDCECGSLGWGVSYAIGDDLSFGAIILCDPCRAAREERVRQQAEEEERRRQEERFCAAVSRAQFSPRHVKYVWTRGGDGAAYAAASEQFVDDVKDGAGLYFHSRPGTGKTSLAVALGLHLLCAGRQVLYWCEPMLFSALRRGSAPRVEPSASSIVAAACKADVLIVDDIGTEERRSEAASDWLSEIVMTRYDHMRSTVWTSNVDPTRLGEVMSDRLARRIEETSKAVVVTPRLLAGANR